MKPLKLPALPFFDIDREYIMHSTSVIRLVNKNVSLPVVVVVIMVVG